MADPRGLDGLFAALQHAIEVIEDETPKLDEPEDLAAEVAQYALKWSAKQLRGILLLFEHDLALEAEPSSEPSWKWR